MCCLAVNAFKGLKEQLTQVFLGGFESSRLPKFLIVFEIFVFTIEHDAGRIWDEANLGANAQPPSCLKHHDVILSNSSAKGNRL